MTQPLRPCPFCGHDTPEFERTGNGRRSCIVACGDCGARHESADEGDRSGTSWNLRESDARIAELTAEVERLRRDCGEAYQVIGAAMLGASCAYTQDDVVRALDNLNAAAAGDPRPHDDLLPWPASVAAAIAAIPPATAQPHGG